MASPIFNTTYPTAPRVPILGRKCVDSVADQSSSMSLGSPVDQCLLTKQPTDLNNNLNVERYRTEMCHNFQENGFCKYGNKCQFAHFQHEIRTVSRHPKYKTEICRTYHMTGLCRYGTRCHFIHEQQQSTRYPSATSPQASSTTTSVDSDTDLPLPKVTPLDNPTPVVDYPTHLSYTSYATNLFINTDPMVSFTDGLKSVGSSGKTIVQDCLSDMYFSATSPVCQADETCGSSVPSSRLPVFVSLCCTSSS